MLLLLLMMMMMVMSSYMYVLFRWLVFGGAISALGLMTVLSVCLGFATMIIPHAVTFYITTTLLALFGLKMLYDGYKMDPNEGQEELNEVTEDLRMREEMVKGHQMFHSCLCMNVHARSWSGSTNRH